MHPDAQAILAAAVILVIGSVFRRWFHPTGVWSDGFLLFCRIGGRIVFPPHYELFFPGTQRKRQLASSLF